MQFFYRFLGTLKPCAVQISIIAIKQVLHGSLDRPEQNCCTLPKLIIGGIEAPGNDFVNIFFISGHRAPAVPSNDLIEEGGVVHLAGGI